MREWGMERCVWRIVCRNKVKEYLEIICAYSEIGPNKFYLYFLVAADILLCIRGRKVVFSIFQEFLMLPIYLLNFTRKGENV